MLAEDRTTEADRELIMEGWRHRNIGMTCFSSTIIFSARKKQADKLKKLSSVKTDSCDTESVNDDGKLEQ